VFLVALIFQSFMRLTLKRNCPLQSFSFDVDGLSDKVRRSLVDENGVIGKIKARGVQVHVQFFALMLMIVAGDFLLLEFVTISAFQENPATEKVSDGSAAGPKRGRPKKINKRELSDEASKSSVRSRPRKHSTSVEDEKVEQDQKLNVKVFPDVERGGRGRPRKQLHPVEPGKGTRSHKPANLREVSLGEARNIQGKVNIRAEDSDEVDPTSKADRGASRSVSPSAAQGVRPPTTLPIRGRGRPRKSLAKATPSGQEAQVGGRGRGRGRIRAHGH
jgi:hypothetical protein